MGIWNRSTSPTPASWTSCWLGFRGLHPDPLFAPPTSGAGEFVWRGQVLRLLWKEPGYRWILGKFSMWNPFFKDKKWETHWETHSNNNCTPMPQIWKSDVVHPFSRIECAKIQKHSGALGEQALHVIISTDKFVFIWKSVHIVGRNL